MHKTAHENCKLFFKCYGPYIKENPIVVDIGSQDINGSLRETVPQGFQYIGMDFSPGKSVDVVLDSPYELPLEKDSVDVVISSSCFEHSQLFWLVFIEIMRVLKPTGLFYLNAPSNGSFHRYPVDCWRFYPDSGGALVTWARRNNFETILLESYVSNQRGDIWNDFVAIFLKSQRHLNSYPIRILDDFNDFNNGIKYGVPGFLKYNRLPQDLQKINLISKVISAGK